MTDDDRCKRLIRGMIANDDPCPSPFCDVSMMGHLLAGLDDELIELVKSQDKSQPEYEGDLQ